MSILLRWKNKLQDSTYEQTRIRQFDEHVSLLKTENVELHKRIDQLEALCTTNVDTQRARFLQHIRNLEEENGRLFAENQCQRYEYEQFLDQLTTMVLRTAVMQENIRKECASIYHVIERLSTVVTTAIAAKHSRQIGHRTKRLRSLSWEHLTQPCELIQSSPIVDCRLSSSTPPTTTAEFIRQLCKDRSSFSSSSSSSCSSSRTTHCSFSTSGSWTLDLSSFEKERKTQSPSSLPVSTEQTGSSSLSIEEQQQVLQRSETFVVTKLPQEEIFSSPSSLLVLPTMTMKIVDTNPTSNVQRCTTTRSMAASTSTVVRASRLPSRRPINRNENGSNSSVPNKTPPANNNNRSLSTQKVSKVPVRTASLIPKPTPVKKINLPTPVVAKTKKNSTVVSARSVGPVSTAPKKTIRPPVTPKNVPSQPPSAKARSRSTATVGSVHTPHVPSSVNKRTRTTPPVAKKTTIEPVPPKKAVKFVEKESISHIEQMNSTSSDSSIEEKQQTNKPIVTIQDEGYSTWSSSDVKTDVTLTVLNNLRKSADERRCNEGLVKSWLDTSNKRCSRKPVKEVAIDKLEAFTRELPDGPSFICPFVRNRCSNGIIIPIAPSPPLPPPSSSSPIKDISLDSLEDADSPRSKEQSSLSSSTNTTTSTSPSMFSRSETFERVLVANTLPTITDDLADSTDSTCSDLNQLFAMSEYIEDDFTGDDDSGNEHSFSLDTTTTTNSSVITTTMGRIRQLPQKRLLVPGLLNRLVFLRRVLSDSDLRRKVCCIGENEIQFHVYHSDTIHEHSIELNLMNTYGSESELHVWQHDCAEQRRFVSERQRLSITPLESESKMAQLEQKMMMALEDDDEDERNFYEYSYSEEYDQQLALERQALLQQIYEYPWLLPDDDLDQIAVFPSPTGEPSLSSPSPDIIVPSPNPDFYQLCALTNSSSFATSYGASSRHTTPPIASSLL